MEKTKCQEQKSAKPEVVEILCHPCYAFSIGEPSFNCQAAQNARKPFSKKLQSTIMGIIDDRSGGVKSGDLLTEVICALGGWKDRVSVLQSRLNATLTLMQSQGRIGIVNYKVRFGGSSYESRSFIYRPLPSDNKCQSKSQNR